MQEIFFNCNDLDWQPAQNYPMCTFRKVLRDYEDKKTILLRLPPGFIMDKHSHTVVEQHYVLEGSYEIEGKIFEQGSYQLIPPGFSHGPFYSKNGAIILIIWDPHK
jgi:anti-sigma factor ChrR (cupin superfamily)